MHVYLFSCLYSYRYRYGDGIGKTSRSLNKWYWHLFPLLFGASTELWKIQSNCGAERNGKVKREISKNIHSNQRGVRAFFFSLCVFVIESGFKQTRTRENKYKTFRLNQGFILFFLSCYATGIHRSKHLFEWGITTLRRTRKEAIYPCR